MTPLAPDPPLRWILERAGGRVSFEGFMEAALHDPEHGYYATRPRITGRRGDFATAATLGPVLAEALAAWAWERRRILPRGAWHLVEIGGGDGSLAANLRDALPWRARMALRIHLVERSPARRAEQEARLRTARRASWHDDPASAMRACGGEALLYSNELVDAFACKRLQYAKGAWRELGLALVDGALAETLGPLSDQRILSDLCSLPGGLAAPAEGQRIEVHLAYHDWLASWAAAFRLGSALTLDYGGESEELYAARPGGSVRGFFHHQRLEGSEIYRRFGRQDLTADVNFTDLMRWGEAVGLATVRLGSQREFLRAFHPGAEREAPHEPLSEYLLHPAGAGGAYRVLEQVRVPRGLTVRKW